MTLHATYAVHPNRICSRPHSSRRILPPTHRRTLRRRRHHLHSRCRHYLRRLHQLRVTATTVTTAVVVSDSVCIVIGFTAFVIRHHNGMTREDLFRWKSSRVGGRTCTTSRCRDLQPVDVDDRYVVQDANDIRHARVCAGECLVHFAVEALEWIIRPRTRSSKAIRIPTV
jgi:hypothetical protein